MQRISMVVTDVTRMHHGHFCVAGWSLQSQRMIRPMPRYGYWTKQDLEAVRLEPGAVISVAKIEDASSDFPHRAEDMIVLQLQVQCLAPPPFDWFGPQGPATVPSVSAAFAPWLRHTASFHGVLKGNYVDAGAEVASLIGLEMRGTDLAFFEYSYDGKTKLRVRLADRSAAYDLPVVSEALLQIYEKQGLLVLRQLIAAQRKVHVRIGLARPWGEHKNRCSLMLNGVHW